MKKKKIIPGTGFLKFEVYWKKKEKKWIIKVLLFENKNNPGTGFLKSVRLTKKKVSFRWW